MDNLLYLVLSLSLSGGILVLFVAVLNRLLRGKLPRSFLCCLWLLVLVRFLLPVGTSWSLMNRLLGTFQETHTQVSPPVGTPTLSGEANLPAASDEVYIPAVPEADRPPAPALAKPSPSVSSLPSAASVLTAVWGFGVLAFLGWRLCSYHRLNRALTEEELPVADWELELYSGLAGERRACPALRRSEAIQSPMLAGVLRPVIWLPANSLDAAELSYALRHELIHWRRHDLYCKWAAALTACLHWFNPAVWYLLRAVDRDCELSCDEAVVKGLSLRDRRVYGELLLRCAAGKAPTGALYTSLKTQKQVMRERLTVIMKKNPDSKKTRALFAAAAAVVILTGAVLGAYAAWGETGTDRDTTIGETEPNGAATIVGTELNGDTTVKGTETDGNTTVEGTETDGDTTVEGTGSEGSAALETDLNRNGVPETINVVWQDDEMRYQLTVTEGDEVIFTQNAYAAHVGWLALFLYQKDGQDYLLRYIPGMWMGNAYYSYQLFYLAENGAEVVVQENEVSFDINFGSSLHGDFDPAAIDAFLTEVNALLSDSIQLMNTDHDLREAFRLEDRLYHVPTFLRWREESSYYDESKTMLENLLAYQSAVEELYS